MDIISHKINNTDCTLTYYMLIFLLQISLVVNTYPKAL